MYIRCRKELSKSIKDASHPDHKSSHSRSLSFHKLSFYSMFPMSKWDMDVYLALPSLPPFLSIRSSPFFMIGLHILFSVALDAARFFWNASCKIFCSCSKVLERRSLAYEENQLRLLQLPVGSCNQQNHSGFCTLYSPPPLFVQQNTHVHNHWAVPIGSHPKYPTVFVVNSHCFQLCACSLQTCKFPRTTKILVIEK